MIKIFSYKNYCKVVNPIADKHNKDLIEWQKVEKKHVELNGKLEELFKIAEDNNGLTKEQFNQYFNIRSENDVINSKMKLLSVKTNDSNIKIQRISQLFMNQSKEVEIEFVKVIKNVGRIMFKIRRKNAL